MKKIGELFIENKVLTQKELDQNDLYKQNPQIAKIPVYSPLVNAVHLKDECLGILLYTLLSTDHPDSIKNSIEHLLDHLLLENLPFAPCLNVSLGLYLKYMYLLFPEYTANLIRSKINRFIDRFKTDEVTPKINIMKDILHITSHLLRNFKDLREQSFSHLNAKQVNLWDNAMLFSEQTLLGTKKNPGFFYEHRKELLGLIATMFRNLSGPFIAH